MTGSRRAVVAFGGNALISDDAHQSIPDQYETAVRTSGAVIDMVEAGWGVVLTHGNGPQVGYILRRSELAADEVAPVPLDYAVGDTQGAIGYMFAKALRNEMHARGLRREVAVVVTQTVVDPTDPAFTHPSKPIGAFLDEVTARRYADELGWTVMRDGDRGWRRSVASPEPTEIVEIDTIRRLADAGTVVIACGGGGIPVARRADGSIAGVEAVVDKDRASALLAAQLDSELLVIPTGVEKVAIGFGTPQQRWLDRITPAEAARYAGEGQFGAGSMAPKVQAAVDFVAARPGGAGVITAPHRLAAALDRRTGTWIEKTSDENGTSCAPR